MRCIYIYIYVYIQNGGKTCTKKSDEKTSQKTSAWNTLCGVVLRSFLGRMGFQDGTELTQVWIEWTATVLLVLSRCILLAQCCQNLLTWRNPQNNISCPEKYLPIKRLRDRKHRGGLQHTEFKSVPPIAGQNFLFDIEIDNCKFSQYFKMFMYLFQDFSRCLVNPDRETLGRQKTTYVLLLTHLRSYPRGW